MALFTHEKEKNTFTGLTRHVHQDNKNGYRQSLFLFCLIKRSLHLRKDLFAKIVSL